MNYSLNILYEDNDILVCHKPAGLATESASVRSKDLVDLVREHLTHNGVINPFIGLVHRLDLPVAGILVIAKNKEAAATLSRQVQTESMGKIYVATVQGHITPDVVPDDDGSYIIKDYLVKDSKSNKAMIVGKDQKGPDGKPAKEATLKLTVLSYDDENNTSLVKIQLLTGRFHQIRAQLANLGHPILYDVKYGADLATHNRPDGIALCASELHFRHPTTRKDMKFTI